MFFIGTVLLTLHKSILVVVVKDCNLYGALADHMTSSQSGV